MSDEFDEENLPTLSAENAAEVLEEYEGAFVLPEAGSLPACRVLVKSAPIDRINAFQKASKSGNDKRTFDALCQLIAATVVGPDGSPVWTRATIQKLAKANTKRFVEIQYGVLRHNGLNKDKDDLEDTIEDEAKN